MRPVNALHHITAISGPAQENLDFYSGVLGLRLVKRSVNQDDPGTYHLFYADAAGHPGTDITFFPWDRMAPSRSGWGLSVEAALEVPRGSSAFWKQRLNAHRTPTAESEDRFGRATLGMLDPHGLRIALVESEPSSDRGFTPWAESPVPAEAQIRGLAGARLVERALGPTTDFLAQALGFTRVGQQGEWERWALDGDGPGHYLDLRSDPVGRRGAWGIGSIHHLAWRVEDEAHQAAVREQILAAGIETTPVIDRFWFKSVYFREPGGVLFELATDGPGFAVDEDAEHLGESLVLPPWLEPERAAIEQALPRLSPPQGNGN